MKCRHCGEYLDEDRKDARDRRRQPGRERTRRWSPALAALLRFPFPGLGQMYKGRVAVGLIWFLMVGFAYAVSLGFGLLGFGLCC